MALARSLLPGLIACSLLSLAPASLQVVASARADESVYSCGVNDAGGENNIFSGYETFGIATLDLCSSGEFLDVANDGINKVPPGMSSGYIATAPAGLEITSAHVTAMELTNTTVGTGYIAEFYWGGGSQRVDDAWTTYSVGGLLSDTFGFSLGCSASGTTCPADGAGMQVNDIQLKVAETVNPTVNALGGDNLWSKGASEYVRGGGWSVAYSASAPSGIDSMSASENGQLITYPAAPGCTPNDKVWQQCPGSQTWSPTISLSGSGDQQLVLAATSAAGNVAVPTETLHVDSVTPTVTLSGPTQASSTAGTQYVTATASVGPSGLGSISCSTDGGPAQSYSTSPASIPVSGVGVHSIQCTASNRSYNPWGQVAVSTPATWSLDIAQPTVSGVSFSNIIHGLKCKPVRERVRVAARWVAVRRHGKLVKVHRRAHTKVVKAVRCHPRIVRRKVTVVLREKKHGRTVLVKRKKVERVVMPPQVVSQPNKRVAFGKGATVSGFLGMGSGTALGGRTVAVLTAPNNGLGQWTLAAVVTTNADGGWSATLPAGPSRLVEAAYGGDSTTEPSTSSTIELIVPAKVKLRVHPRRVRWGGTIRISGRVFGAHIPAGKLLRLRIGVAGVHETVGIPNIRRNGRFHTTWKFAAGSGVVRYWFSISTLNEADYPYAPGSSRRVYVTVGPG